MNHHGLDIGGTLVRKLIVLGVALVAVTSCSTSAPTKEPPGMAPRGTQMTTAKPSRQDLTNKVSLSGKVAINPVFGLVSPVGGQIRYLDVKTPEKTPVKPTKVANVFVSGKANAVEVPAGAVFSGRLVDDKATVTAGMPIVSAKHVGYGVVADIKGEQAYKLSETLSSIMDAPDPRSSWHSCAVMQSSSGAQQAMPATSSPPHSAPTP
jgi:hypothetical protein